MRAPLVISGRQVHRPSDGVLTRFPLERGKRLVRYPRPWNFHSLPSLDRTVPECEQRFAQFIIDLHADSSYIIRPRFLGLERFQWTREDASVYGGCFNRNCILSYGVIGPFCPIL